MLGWMNLDLPYVPGFWPAFGVLWQILASSTSQGCLLLPVRALLITNACSDPITTDVHISRPSGVPVIETVCPRLTKNRARDLVT